MFTALWRKLRPIPEAEPEDDNDAPLFRLLQYMLARGFHENAQAIEISLASLEELQRVEGEIEEAYRQGDLSDDVDGALCQARAQATLIADSDCHIFYIADGERREAFSVPWRLYADLLHYLIKYAYGAREFDFPLSEQGSCRLRSDAELDEQRSTTHLSLLSASALPELDAPDMMF